MGSGGKRGIRQGIRQAWWGREGWYGGVYSRKLGKVAGEGRECLWEGTQNPGKVNKPQVAGGMVVGG